MLSDWEDATLAAALFAVDGAGTGVVLKAAAGPVRDRWLSMLTAALPARPRRLPLGIADERLLGGLDLAATLQAGRPVAQCGLLADSDGGVVLVAMAERLPKATAARLAAAIDLREVRVERDGIALCQPARFGCIAFDEGLAEDDAVPPALTDRLAFHVDLTAVSQRGAGDSVLGDLTAARERVRRVEVHGDIVQALCAAAVALGIASLRAPLLALGAARAHAALEGRDAVTADDAAVAARLVLAPRATTAPPAPEDAGDADPADGQTARRQEPPTPPTTADAAAAHQATAPPPPAAAPPADEPSIAEPDGPSQQQQAVADRVLEAAVAALPAALLAQLRSEHAPRQQARAAGKSGALQQAAERGRPVGVRRAVPRGGQRLNLLATLRAAAPWQRLREAVAPRIAVRADDFHATRYRQRQQTTTIFVVDASGSSALNRLAEAKGAVELLLAECYVRRDSVAVLAFRGRGAELLLPPTRSLVRAKRSLAGLPGGGGTPLAAAIDAATSLADAVRRRGDTPLVVLLTDGRANVALDGSGGRVQADVDAMAAALRLRAGGAAALLIDTSPQPHPQAARLARQMQATYLPLPHAGAEALSRAVRAAA